MSDHPLDEVLQAAGAQFDQIDGLRCAADFGDVHREYDAAVNGSGVHDARARGLIEITGRDRADWLENLVTNTIKPLAPGEGNYAFAPDAKGRIQFDLNMLVRDDAIWVDVDRRQVERALAHFDKYTITEDVRCADRSEAFVRIALLGPRAVGICDALGAAHGAAMASLSSTTGVLLDKPRLLVRHDFAGVFGVEVYLEADDAAAGWSRLLEIGQPVNLTPIGRSAVHVLRVEAGIPASVEDIDDTVLPAETQQTERAVSRQKGCYLGQEVVERMRSHGAVARKLVGLRVSEDREIDPGTTLRIDSADVGRVTSVCRSFACESTVALGYVKSASATPGTRVTLATQPPVDAEVAALPFRSTG